MITRGWKTGRVLLLFLLFCALGRPLSANAVPVVTVLAADPTANEFGSNSATFAVSRSGSTHSRLVVHYTIGGTASQGTDYRGLPGSVTIPAGASSARIRVRPINDGQIEGSETVVLTLSRDRKYSRGLPDRATITIADDDLTPIFRSAPIHPSDAGWAEEFGGAVALDGDTLVSSSTRATYVFVHDGTGWVEQQQIPFAGPVAISGDTLVIGSTATYLPAGTGVARVFVRSGTHWTLQATLVTATGETKDNFGAAVAIAGHTIFVGAPGDVPHDTPSGSVHVFARDGSDWRRQARLQAGGIGGQFGYALAIDQDTAVVGARLASTAHVFARKGTEWIQQAILAGGGHFGTSVALSGDTVVIGAPLDDQQGSQTGAAHVFVRRGTNWLEQATLRPREDRTWTFFGSSVAIHGNRVVVGMPLVEWDEFPDVSGAYLFARTGSSWSEQTKLDPSATVRKRNFGMDRLGMATAITGQWIALGAPGSDAVGIINAGSVYLFEPETAPVITVAATDRCAREGGLDAGQFTITRSGDTSGQLTVLYWIQGTAIGGQDYDRLTGSVTMAAGDSFAVVAINPVSDSDMEDTETVVLMLRPDVAYAVGPMNRDVVIIEDKNQRSPPAQLPTVTVTATANTSENGPDPGHFTISRTGQTTTPLTVYHSLAGGIDYQPFMWAGGSPITIPAGQTSVTVNVIPVDDNLVEGPETITLSLMENDSYVVGSPSYARLTIEDNDQFLTQPVVTVTARSSVAFESGTNPGVFTIVRHGSTNSALTVSYTLAGTADNGIDYQQLETSVTIPAGSRSSDISVFPTGDNEVEATETAILTLSSNAAYTIGSPGGSDAIWIISNDPVTTEIHPLVQKINNPAPILEDRDGGGRSLAMSADGGTIVIGLFHDCSAGTNAGAVHVYVRSGNGWDLEQKLFASDASDHDYFGTSVAIDRGTIVVGARQGFVPNKYGHDLFDAKGAVYVFGWDGRTWTETQKLLPGDAHGEFGHALAISGDTLVVGAPNIPRAYVFERNGSIWHEQQQLIPRVTGCGEYFGTSVAIAGDTLVIGAPGYSESSEDACGAAYVFARNGETWTEQQRLTGNTLQTFTWFGSTVALDGATLVVGAPLESAGPELDSFGTGAAYIFGQNASGWDLQQRLTLPEGIRDDHFGNSLAIEGDTLAVGNRCSPMNEILSGSVCIFRRHGTSWTREETLKAHDQPVMDSFGRSIAISAGTLVVRSFGREETTYVYELEGTAWSSWNGVDIGTLSARGGESFANGIFTVTGSGYDIWGKADEFHLVYRRWIGDGEIVARVIAVAAMDPLAKAGVMFRENLDPTSRHAMALVTPGYGAGLQRRITTGGSSEFTHGAPLAKAPSWIRLVRRGSIFTAYHSDDGTKWRFGGSVAIDMPESLYVGLAVTSHRDGTLCAATFDNVSVSSGNLATGAAPPFISDLRRHSGDVIELIIHGQPGHTYKVEASTNLLHWTPLATPLNTTGSFTLIDPDAPNHPVRFYRVILER